MIRVLALCLVGTLFQQIQAQNLERGLPFVTNYSPKDYGAEAQNWAFAQADNGLLYVGNSGGVLEFDGRNWTLIRMTNNSACLSLAKGLTDGIIYCGGQSEFGRLAPDSTGRMVYQSLKSLVPEPYAGFKEIRKIISTHESVLFLSNDPSLILKYDGLKVVGIEPENSLSQFAFNTGSNLYFLDSGVGLVILDGADFQEVPGSGELGGYGQISMVQEIGNRLFVGTWHNGIFTLTDDQLTSYDVPVNDYLKSNLFYTSHPLATGELILGTISGGAIITNRNLELLLKLDRRSGIADNTILSLFEDREGNIWLGTNNGISYVEYASPFRQFPKEWGFDGNIQTITRFGGSLYLGTSRGIFKLRDPSADEVLAGVLPQFQIQDYGNVDCFALFPAGNTMLAGSYQNVIAISDQGVQNISTGEVNCFVSSKKGRDLIYVGLRDGVVVLHNTDQGFVLEEKLDGIDVEVRSIVEDDKGTLWLGSFYDGIIRVNLETGETSHYGEAQGLPSLRNNEVFEIHGQTYVASMEGLLQLDDDTGVFKTANDFPESFQNAWIYRMIAKDTSSMLVHFYNDSRTVEAKKEGGGYVEINSPYQRMDGFPVYAMFTEEDGAIWFGGPDGLIKQISRTEPRNPQPPSTLVRQMWFKDSLFYDQVDAKVPSFAFKQNSLRFESAATSFELPEASQFQYWLYGYEDAWSDWTSDPARVYTNLDPGAYNFKVQSRNAFGLQGSVAEYSFNIKTPWFRSIWFTLLYVLVGFGLLAWIVRYFSTRKLIRKVEALELERKVIEERERISSDLHDHIGAQLTSIISGLKVTEKFTSASDEVEMKNLIDSLKEDAQSTILNLRDTIWTLKQETITLTEFKDRLNVVTSNLLKYNKEILCTVELTGIAGEPLHHGQALSLLRIVLEAIQNTIKHARATQIEIKMEGAQSSVHLSISDNGSGFDPNTVVSNGGHYGLSNMRKRVNEFNGDISIRSTPGNGTIVSINLPRIQPG